MQVRTLERGLELLKRTGYMGHILIGVVVFADQSGLIKIICKGLGKVMGVQESKKVKQN